MMMMTMPPLVSKKRRKESNTSSRRLPIPPSAPLAMNGALISLIAFGILLSTILIDKAVATATTVVHLNHHHHGVDNAASSADVSASLSPEHPHHHMAEEVCATLRSCASVNSPSADESQGVVVPETVVEQGLRYVDIDSTLSSNSNNGSSFDEENRQNQQQQYLQDYKEEEDEEDEEEDEEEEEDLGGIEEDDEEEEEEQEPGAYFGVIQTLEQEIVPVESVWEKLVETEEYMNNFAETQDPFVFIRRDCWNKVELCTVWAVSGECTNNPDYMAEQCAPACGKCVKPEGPGVDFGVPQLLEYAPGGRPNPTSDAITTKFAETERYIREVIWADDFYTKVRRLCFNKDKMCTIWAAKGECTANPKFMAHHCSASCGTCAQLHYETRCPVDPEKFPDLWQPGDLNRMFERIVADPAYDTTVWSRPDYLPGDTEETATYEVGPWIITVDNFITPEEAAHLIDWGGYMGYERSEEVGGYDSDTGEALESVKSEDRTSTNSWCTDECDNDDIVVDIFDRIEEMTGVPPENSESLQLLKYESDQFYLTHSDFIEGSEMFPGGPRILTVFMYLSEVEEGGETRFDWSDIKIMPKLGRVAIWPSVLDEDPNIADERTFHEAMPVIQGQKFAANAWLHLRNYEVATMMGC